MATSLESFIEKDLILLSIVGLKITVTMGWSKTSQPKWHYSRPCAVLSTSSSHDVSETWQLGSLETALSILEDLGLNSTEAYNAHDHPTAKPPHLKIPLPSPPVTTRKPPKTKYPATTPLVLGSARR